MITGAAGTRTVLYSAYFCPYAQRVWSALNELQRPYTLVEALEIDPATEAYVKHKDLMHYNPKGLVPTVVSINTDTGESETYCDSLDILKVLYASRDETEQLYEQAKDWNARICSPFYNVMIRQEEQDSLTDWKEMVQNLRMFSDTLSYEDGTISFYNHGADEPCLVDLAVFPFIHRLYIIEHFKGLSLPERNENERHAKQKINDWRKRMEGRPAIRETLAPPDRLIPIYQPYSDGTAKSKVADAVRQGHEAHSV